MFAWAALFLIVAVIAGVAGLAGIAIVSVEIAKTIFLVAIVLFLVSAALAIARGRSVRAP
jgi:uncharacterized membrane protein YtjA (UPF0391 family)